VNGAGGGAAARLAIPQTILGETALSLLGLGLQPPVVSWGVLLQDAQNVQAMAHHGWLLIPLPVRHCSGPIASGDSVLVRGRRRHWRRGGGPCSR